MIPNNNDWSNDFEKNEIKFLEYEELPEDTIYSIFKYNKVNFGYGI